MMACDNSKPDSEASGISQIPVIPIVPKAPEIPKIANDADPVINLKVSHVLGKKYIPEDLEFLLVTQSGIGRPALLKYDVETECFIGSVKPGRYESLEVREPPSLFKLSWTTQFPLLLLRAPIGLIKKGESLDLGLLKLPTKPILISGTLFDEDGGLLAAARLTVVQDGKQQRFYGVSESNGTFEIRGWPLPKGSFRVEFEDPNRKATRQFESGQTHVDLSCELVGSISGKISDYRSRYVHRVLQWPHVRVLREGSEISEYVYVKNDGSFSAQQLEAGNYRLLFIVNEQVIETRVGIKVGSGEHVAPEDLRDVDLWANFEVAAVEVFDSKGQSCRGKFVFFEEIGKAKDMAISFADLTNEEGRCEFLHKRGLKFVVRVYSKIPGSDKEAPLAVFKNPRFPLKVTLRD
ncbi:MAG: hypothetical protein ACI97A_002087 [Planctomycetota bacterium]|jgi:hypothetical protein